MRLQIVANHPLSPQDVSYNHKTSLITTRRLLQRQDVSYNGQVIPASTSVNFLGITFDSALTFKSHYHTLANIARHRLLKLNSIFTSTYGPSTSTLIRLYKSYIRSLFDYSAPATCVASLHVQRIWEGVQTHFITRALSIPHASSTTIENGSTLTFHQSMIETCT